MLKFSGKSEEVLYTKENIFIMTRSKYTRLNGLQAMRTSTVSYTHLDVYKRQLLHYIFYFKSVNNTMETKINYDIKK